MKKFVDTNIFLRFLTRDNPEKAQKILEFFEVAKRKEWQLVTSDLVIAEVVWVLSSKRLFNLPKEKVKESFLPLLLEDFISFASKGFIAHVFEIFVEKDISFIDAYNAIYARRIQADTILSYDKDFDKLDFITREEP
jgi:predicted nucleic acid-binding protein